MRDLVRAGFSAEFVFRVGDVFVCHGTRRQRCNDSDRERLISRIIAGCNEVWRCEQTEEPAVQARLGMPMTQLTVAQQVRALRGMSVRFGLWVILLA